MIVVDSTVVAYCWIRSQRTELAQRVRASDPVWHVPVLWRSEVRSALAGYIRQGTLESKQAMTIVASSETALTGCEHLVASAKVLELISACGLSAYDCEFVALAQWLAVPLVTEDRAVLKAFPEMALTMEDFLERFPAAPPSR